MRGRLLDHSPKCRVSCRLAIASHTREDVASLTPDSASWIPAAELARRVRGSRRGRGIEPAVPIAERSDFLCVGTNDFTQYTWAAGRDDESVLLRMGFRGLSIAPRLIPTELIRSIQIASAG